MSTTSPKAFSYLRFSSPEQMKGDSLRRQTELAREYADRHGLDLDETLTFRDLGVSAFRGKNVAEGALGRFVDAVDSGLVKPGSHLLVESIDRLSRDRITAALGRFSTLLDRGITVVTLTDQKVYTRDSLDNLGDLMMFLVIASRANEESETKSRRGKASWANKRAKAAQEGTPMTAMAPRWLSLNKSTGQFEIIEEKAEIVRRIYSMYVDEAIGKVSIAATLNAKGVPPLSARATGWHHSYVGRILANPAVIGQGTIDHGSTTVDDYFPAIVDRATYYRAQKIRTEKALPSGRHGPSFPNLFRGLAKCGTCGATMHYLNKGKRWSTSTKANVYLQCSNARRKAGNCSHVALWSYDAVEYFVTEGIARDIDFSALYPEATDAARRQLEAAQGQLEAAKGELADAERQLENVVDLLADRPDQPSLLGRLDALEERRAALTADVEQWAAKEQVARDEMVTASERFQTQDDLLARWRDEGGKEDPKLRERLNASLRANISRIEFAPDPENGGAVSYARVIFGANGERHWTVVIQPQEQRGHFVATSHPFDSATDDMVDGGAGVMTWPDKDEADEIERT